MRCGSVKALSAPLHIRGGGLNGNGTTLSPVGGPDDRDPDPGCGRAPADGAPVFREKGIDKGASPDETFSIRPVRRDGPDRAAGGSGILPLDPGRSAPLSGGRRLFDLLFLEETLPRGAGFIPGRAHPLRGRLFLPGRAGDGKLDRDCPPCGGQRRRVRLASAPPGKDARTGNCLRRDHHGHGDRRRVADGKREPGIFGPGARPGGGDSLLPLGHLHRAPALCYLELLQPRRRTAALFHGPVPDLIFHPFCLTAEKNRMPDGIGGRRRTGRRRTDHGLKAPSLEIPASAVMRARRRGEKPRDRQREWKETSSGGEIADRHSGGSHEKRSSIQKEA